ncbi:hypothetical protein J2S43_002804 [Catenuloplanes nepalensis]|uniref:Uncharacterized protein n=1 Tax=Catenuloplanes nepalensis TaxID=587533 RepID=A0ABT9MS79_9ACTN|nr:hypothetical protein [Catenuloplanes nepalensis]MDP9794292.1 hypothetical protein [Catenuloplanes nepalensis]
MGFRRMRRTVEIPVGGATPTEMIATVRERSARLRESRGLSFRVSDSGRVRARMPAFPSTHPSPYLAARIGPRGQGTVVTGRIVESWIVLFWVSMYYGAAAMVGLPMLPLLAFVTGFDNPVPYGLLVLAAVLGWCGFGENRQRHLSFAVEADQLDRALRPLFAPPKHRPRDDPSRHRPRRGTAR